VYAYTLYSGSQNSSDNIPSYLTTAQMMSTEGRKAERWKIINHHQY